MLSRQLKELAQAITGREAKIAPLFEAAFSISAVLDSLLESCFRNAGSPQRIEIQNIVLSGVTAAVRKNRVWDVHEAAKNYLAALAAISDDLNRADDQLAIVRESTTDFIDLYGEFLSLQSFENAFRLARQARDLEKTLTGMRDLSELLLDCLGEGQGAEQEGVLTLFSPAEIHGARELSRMLVGIQKIYDEVAGLIEGEVEYAPLVLLKVETGSLFVSVKGAVKAIRIVGGILKEALAYGARNHTISGSLAKLPAAFQGVEGVIRLRTLMAEAGMSEGSIAKMDDKIEESSLRLAAHVANVMERMSEVGVDGEVYAVGKKLVEQLKLSSEPKRLRHDEGNED